MVPDQFFLKQQLLDDLVLEKLDDVGLLIQFLHQNILLISEENRDFLLVFNHLVLLFCRYLFQFFDPQVLDLDIMIEVLQLQIDLRGLLFKVGLHLILYLTKYMVLLHQSLDLELVLLGDILDLVSLFLYLVNLHLHPRQLVIEFGGMG